MIIVALIELLLIFLTAWFIVKQLLIPAIRGTVVFPMFRKEHDLRTIVLEQRQQAVEQSLERAIAEQNEVLTPSVKAEDSNVVTPKEIV